MARWQGWMVLMALAVTPVSGCRTGVRSFAELNDPAPFVRARAAGLDDLVSDAQAIPALIAHLEDEDPVVRLSSHEALRDRTRQDFGFIPWGTPEERAAAVSRWRSWWQSQTVSPSGDWQAPRSGSGPRPLG